VKRIRCLNPVTILYLNPEENMRFHISLKHP
jgi:hypothetical protein